MKKKLWIAMLVMAMTSGTLTACSGCGKEHADTGTDSLVVMGGTENVDATVESEEETQAAMAETDDIQEEESVSAESKTEETRESVEETGESSEEPVETKESVVIPEGTKENTASTPVKDEAAKTPEPSRTPEESQVPSTPGREPEPAPTPTQPSNPEPAPTQPSNPQPTEHVHTLVDVVTAEATCDTGKVITTKCSSCGHVEGTRTEGSGLGHEYRENLLYAAACNATGYKSVTCIRCNAIGPGHGDIPMLPHTFHTVIYNEGDCRSPRTREDVCTVCNFHAGIVDDWGAHANDHHWVTGTIQVWSDEAWAMIDVPRTCCSVCGREP